MTDFCRLSPHQQHSLVVQQDFYDGAFLYCVLWPVLSYAVPCFSLQCSNVRCCFCLWLSCCCSCKKCSSLRNKPRWLKPKTIHFTDWSHSLQKGICTQKSVSLCLSFSSSLHLITPTWFSLWHPLIFNIEVIGKPAFYFQKPNKSR